MSEDDVKEWAGRKKPGMPIFPGPADIREAFIQAKGIDWTASYIDPATWLQASRAIVARTYYAERTIKEQASIICANLRVKIMPPDRSERIAAE